MLRKISLVAITLALALAMMILFQHFAFQAFMVPSTSMEPTLQVGERILVNKFAPVERGDIVVFTDPDNWLTPEQGGFLVKRVVGVGGDKIYCCNVSGNLEVNGQNIEESSYILDAGRTDQINFDVTVPKGKLFVMGDNRNNSPDSRYHLIAPDDPFVPTSNVVGKAVMVLWPLADLRRITDQAAVLNKVSPP
jgi:signal peptidase I